VVWSVRATKQLSIVVVLAALVGGGYVVHDRVLGKAEVAPKHAGTAQAPGQPVETATAKPRKLETRAEVVGTSLARRSIEVVPLTTGRVRAITFRAGDRVAAGQVLVELDDEIERADLAQAEATLMQTRQALQRARTLRDKDHVAEATVEDLTSKSASAAAALDRARRKLADRSIRAPFPGVVGINRVDVGARVDDDTVIATLDDLAQIEIECSIAEQFYSRVAIGQPAEATSVSFPGRTFQGKVAVVDSRVNAASRSFKVRIAVPNPDLVLPAGMFMLVRLTLEIHTGLTVPEEAIVPAAGAAYVYVVEGGKAHRRKVVVGDRDVGVAEIKEGLSAGEVVVVKGLASLRDGVPVDVVRNSGASG
jgi:membrane fusion protein (multidrug efflux system)